MEGNIVNIPLKGIARAGSNQSCEDGLCNEIIGLEWKDGSYVPVGFDETYSDFQLVLGENQSYDKVWIHKTTQQDNIILSIKYEGQGYQYRWTKVKEDNSPYLSADFTLLCTTKDSFDKIGIVNNTIRIEDKVFLFYNDQYNELNISDIDFSMQLDVRRNGVAILHDWCDKTVQKQITDNGDTWEGTWAKQTLQKLESEVKNAEYLTGMAFMRYAIKLYDGTYINASTPVLVCDTLHENLNNFKRVDIQNHDSINFNDTSYDSNTNIRITIAQIGYLTNMGWKFRFTDKLDKIYDSDEYKQSREKRLYELNTINSGETFFKEEYKWNTPKTLKSSKWNGRTYVPEFDDEDFNDNKIILKYTHLLSGSGPSTQIMQHYENAEFGKDVRLPNHSGGATNSFNNPTYNVWINSDTNENWFSGNIVGLYDFEIPSEFFYRAKSLGQYFDNGVQKTANSNIHQIFAIRNLATPVFRIINNLSEKDKNLILSVDVFMTRPVSLYENKMEYSVDEGNQRQYKTEQKIKNELADSLVAFYKIYELPFNEIIKLENDNSIYIPYIDRGRISQIEQQETLPQPYPNLDYFDNIFTLNNRLHISGLTTKFFDTYKEDLSLIYPIKQQSSIFSNKEILIKLSILDNNNNKNIYGKIKLPSLFSEFINPYIIYPDERAKTIELLGIVNSTSSTYSPFSSPISYELEAKNGYSILKNLHPIDLSKLNITNTNEPLPNFDNTIIRDKNIFKVSSANNLIDFPLINTYQVGNGDIIGFASSTKALSQGQFGQFPLYVFTTEGIWVMNTNGQGTYSSAEPLSREVCCNPNGILELDGAVLFTTNKGLMLLSGSEVVPFAPLLVGEVGLTPSETEIDNIFVGEEIYRKAVNNSQLVELSGNISDNDFREFVSHIDTRLSYIYDKNKVLIYNKKYNYCYLIDISTSIATKIAEKVMFDDDNYPEPKFGITNNKTMQFKSMAYKLEPNKYTQTMFQTRPIKLGTYDLKSSFRVVLRGKFNVENDKKAGLYVLGSNDTERWMYLGGTERGGSFYDLGTTIHRVSCKYLMVIYVGSISGDSKINGLEISSNAKYNNKLK